MSFHPEDSVKLTEEVFRDIEREFAKSMRLDEHQRVCGVHQNTDHIHLHVSYNLIHPVSHRRQEPFNDYWHRDQVCRQLEKKYGFVIDPGIEAAKQAEKKEAVERRRQKHNGRTALETHAGLKSFEQWAYEQRDDLLEKMKDAKTWADAHRIFAAFGMELKLRGNGIVAKDAHGKKTAKLSALHRSLAYAKMKKLFGEFEEPLEKYPETERHYEKSPVQHDADSGPLWREFKQLDDEKNEKLEYIKAVWEKKRAAIMSDESLRRFPDLRRNLLNLTRAYEKEERHSVLMSMTERYAENWLTFLKHKAREGNEEALAILRSKMGLTPREQMPEAVAFLEEQDVFNEELRHIEEATNLTDEEKRLNSSLLTMKCAAGEQLSFTTRVREDGSLEFDFGKWKDKNGNRVPKRIIDYGDRIDFSEGPPRIAEMYMRLKWNIPFKQYDRRTKETMYADVNGAETHVSAQGKVFRKPVEAKTPHRTYGEYRLEKAIADVHESRAEELAQMKKEDVYFEAKARGMSENLLKRTSRKKYDSDALSDKSVVAIVTMKHVLKNGDGFDFSITNNGTVIFKTADGIVTDDGKTVSWSEKARATAVEYAKLKWSLHPQSRRKEPLPEGAIALRRGRDEIDLLAEETSLTLPPYGESRIVSAPEKAAEPVSHEKAAVARKEVPATEHTATDGAADAGKPVHETDVSEAAPAADSSMTVSAADGPAPEKLNAPDGDGSAADAPRTSNRRTPLVVAHREKDTVKALGARWDAVSHYWYAPPGTDLRPLEHWLSKSAKLSRDEKSHTRVRGGMER